MATDIAAEGSYIASYRITWLLGAGGFGLVYQAYQPFLDRQVAIKVIHTGVPLSRFTEQEFMQEARTIAKLRHPNIVTVYEFGIVQTKEEPLTYMVMEYLSEATLQTTMKKGDLSVEQIVDITEQLADSLDYAHFHNVIHRDLKPSNIMFSAQYQPVIVDFGLAKLVGMGLEPSAVNEIESTTSGTPAYMSPEQILGQRVRAASDQYSPALIVYEMLARKLPFNGETMQEMLASKVSKEPVPLSSVAPQFSPRTDPVLQRALMVDPTARYPTATDFAHALSEALLPDRRFRHVITIPDPIQAAQLRRARQTVLGFMWGLILVALVITLFCSSLFLRGYFNGDSAFIWDGVVASSAMHDSYRDVIAVWPDSPAGTSGIQPGDLIKTDIFYDPQAKDGDYSVNGEARSKYPANLQFQAGDVVEREVMRDGMPIKVSYTLERSTFNLLLFAVQIPAAILAFLCAPWLLRRWGAEPGVQVYTMVLMAGSFTLVASGLTAVIVNIDTLALFILLPLMLHMTLTFPEPVRYFRQHPDRMWLLYLPLPLGLFEFLLGNELFDKFNLLIYIAYVALIVGAIIFKWVRREMKHYPPLRWLVTSWAVASVTALLGTALLAFDDYGTVKALWGGNGLLLYTLDYGIIALGSTLAVLLGTVGLHRVQSVLGKSVATTTDSIEAAPQTLIL